MFIEAVIKKYYYMRKSERCYRHMIDFLKHKRIVLHTETQNYYLPV